jgi:RNA polymerase sigma-70 factor (ECF subfamily)
MDSWSVEDWKQALAERGTDREGEAYQRLGQYLYPQARWFLSTRAASQPYLARLSYAERDDLAREFVQEALSRVWQHYSGFGWRSHVRTWATAILIRCMKQFFRKRARQNELSVSFEEPQADMALDAVEWMAINTPDAKSAGPEGAVEQQELMSAVEAALCQLNSRQRYCIIQLFVRNRSAQEVARDLETSTDNVFVMVFRARKKLKETLRSMGYAEHLGAREVGRP